MTCRNDVDLACIFPRLSTSALGKRPVLQSIQLLSYWFRFGEIQRLFPILGHTQYVHVIAVAFCQLVTTIYPQVFPFHLIQSHIPHSSQILLCTFRILSAADRFSLVNCHPNACHTQVCLSSLRMLLMTYCFCYCQFPVSYYLLSITNKVNCSLHFLVFRLQISNYTLFKKQFVYFSLLVKGYIMDLIYHGCMKKNADGTILLFQVKNVLFQLKNAFGKIHKTLETTG